MGALWWLGPAVLAAVALGAGRWLAAPRREEVVDDAPEDLLALVDSSPYGAMLVGPHDEVLGVNPHGVALGIGRGTRVGFLPLLERVRRARERGEGFAGILERPREAGVEAAVLNVHVVPLAAGRVFVSAEDESAARKVDTVRRDFVTNVSHELKTPIGAIGILSEAVAAATDDPQVTHFAGRLQIESARLAELVGQIIELSRLQTEDPMLERADVEVGGVVAEVIARMRDAADRRQIALVHPEAAPCRVLGDRRQIGDAVANLVQNAINYSDAGARVVVTVERVDDFVEIRVADNGIGIAPEDQERIFERFYRVDYGRSRDLGGTGLGLSIVRHIVQAHGGGVTVWSRPHSGSTFTLRFPARGGEI